MPGYEVYPLREDPVDINEFLLTKRSGETRTKRRRALDLGSSIYDITGFCRGKPTGSEVLLDFVCVTPFRLPLDLVGTRMPADIAATAETVFLLTKNAVQFATATFASSGVAPTFAGAQTDFAVGDILQLVAPASPDATLANFRYTLKGSKI